jgi:uncharacterized membrane protein
MLGLSKTFIAVLIIGALIGYGTKSLFNFIAVIGVYVGLRVIYNIISQ